MSEDKFDDLVVGIICAACLMLIAFDLASPFYDFILQMLERVS